MYPNKDAFKGIFPQPFLMSVDARTSHTISSSKTNIRLRAMPVSVVMMVVMTVVAVVTVGAAVAVDALVAGHALVTRLGKGFSVKDC